MDPVKLTQVVRAIVSQQKSIIGPMAIDLANKVSGIKTSSDLKDLQVSGNSTEILSDLVSQYQKLFGQASVEACKESIRDTKIVFSPKDLPQILQ